MQDTSSSAGIGDPKISLTRIIMSWNCRLEGQELDQHGYLVDIVDVEKHLDEIVNYYREQMLNDKPEFAGLNPSIENFSRILANASATASRQKTSPH